MRAEEFDSYALIEYGTSGEFSYFSTSGQFLKKLKPLEFQQLSIEQIGMLMHRTMIPRLLMMSLTILISVRESRTLLDPLSILSLLDPLSIPSVSNTLRSLDSLFKC